MKPLFLFFATLMVLSCSNDDDLVPRLKFNDDIDTKLSSEIFIEGVNTFEEGIWISITIEDFKKLKVNDRIIKISARTEIGGLVYDIVSQSVEGAFKIDAKTGVVSVEDISVLNNFDDYQIYLDLKISNGVKTIYTTLTIAIDYFTVCNEARNALNTIEYNWFAAKSMVLDTLLTTSYQFRFSLVKDKTMCSIGFPYIETYTPNTTVTMLLKDDAGNEVFNGTQSTYFYNDWWEAYYLDVLRNLDISLIKDKTYTLIFTYNDAYSFPFHRDSEFKSLATPISWGDLKIISFSYTDADGASQTNKAIPHLDIGLK